MSIKHSNFDHLVISIMYTPLNKLYFFSTYVSIRYNLTMKILIKLFLLTSTLMAAQMNYYIIDNTEYSKTTLTLNGQRDVYEIALHKYSNTAQGNKHIFMVHGYLDNCAYSQPIIQKFLSLEYDVTCMELPGHGESSGARADIDHFDSYAIILDQVINSLNLSIYNKNVFYAHSTGNSGMIDLLSNENSFQFDQYILAAPLIRSYLYRLSSFAIGAFGSRIPFIPRKNKIKHNMIYKNILKHDPQPIKWLPMTWARRHIQWNNKMSRTDFSSALKLNIIFGTHDRVIDSKYNEDFLKKRFPQSEIFKVNKSGHHFYFQKNKITKEFYSIIEKILTH